MRGDRRWSRALAAAVVSLSVTLAAFASPLAAVAKQTTVPVPTAAQLALIQITFDSYNRSHLIPDAKLADQLAKDLQLASADLKAGQPDKAQQDLQKFADLLSAQLNVAHGGNSQQGPDQQPINQTAARTLLALANGAAPPTSFTVAPTATTVVATVVASTPVTVTVPPSSPITTISVAPPPAGTVLPPPPPSGVSLASLVITATDAAGKPVTTLPAPMPISANFSAPAGLNPFSAQFSTFDPLTGAPQKLATTVTHNSDGTYAAAASTPHLSPFTVGAGAPVITAIAPVYGPVAGATTVDITGSSLTAPIDVLFDGASVGPTGFNYNPVANTLTATSPAHATARTVDVQVVTVGATSAPVPADQFTYYAPLVAATSASATTIIRNNAVTFADNSTGGYLAHTSDWDFGDSSPHGSGAAPSHGYASPGAYTVTLKVSDSAVPANIATTTLSVNVTLPTISGRVIGAPAGGVVVEAVPFFQIPGDGLDLLAATASAITAPDATYTLFVPNGAYKVHFRQTSTTVQQWSGGAARPINSPTVVVKDDAHPLADATLVAGVAVSGRVTDGSSGLANVFVGAANAATSGPAAFVGGVVTDSLGYYSVTVPASANYQINFGAPAGFLSQSYQPSPVMVGTTPVGLPAVPLVAGDIISGTVTFGGPSKPLQYVFVRFQPAVCCGPGGGSSTDNTGFYQVTVPKGTASYVLQFFPPNPGTSGAAAPVYLGGTTNPFKSPAVGHPSLSNDIDLPVGRLLHGTLSPALQGSQVNVVDPASAMQCCFGPLTGVQTDATGKYAVVIPPGALLVAFNQNGVGNYLLQWWNGATNPNGATPIAATGDVTIDPTLVVGHLISGTVRGTGPVTLPGIGFSVNLVNPDGTCCSKGSFVAGGKSDDTGKYSILVADGVYELRFNAAAHYLPGSIRVTVAGLDTPAQDITLTAGHTISGHVTGPAGPLTSGFVNAQPTSCCQPGFGAGPDQAGSYTLTVPDGTYILTYNPPPGSNLVAQSWNNTPGGSLTQGGALPITISGSDYAPAVDFNVIAGNTISGTVRGTSATGPPLPNINVGLNLAGGGKGSFVTGTQTDLNGFFTFTAPDGSYMLSFDAPSGYLAAQANVSVAGKPVNADQVLQPGFLISGQVFDSTGAPVTQGGGINVQPAGNPGGGFGCICSGVDLTGHYSVTVPNGDWIIQFNPSPGSTLPSAWYDSALAVGAAKVIHIANQNYGTPVDFHLPKAYQLSGTVFQPDGKTGQPGVAVGVNLANPDGTCCVFNGFVTGTQTDGGGHYSVMLADASYSIIFSPPAPYVQITQAVTFIAGSPSTLNETLQAGAVIAGKVVDGAMNGVPNVQVQVSSNGPSGFCCFGTQTDPTGNYSLAVPPGTWLLQFQPQPGGANLAPAWFSATSTTGTPDAATSTALTVAAGTTTTANVTLLPGFVISGQVNGTSGGLSGVFVSLTDTAMIDTCCFPPTGFAMTDASGYYSLVAPGGISWIVQFGGAEAKGYLGQLYNGVTDQHLATPVSSANSHIDATLVKGVLLTGTVNPTTGGLPGVNVFVPGFASVTTDGAGHYRLLVPIGHPSITVNPPAGWFPTTVTVDTTGTAPTFSIDLTLGSVISGRVTTDGTTGLANVDVSAFGVDSGCCYGSRTDSTGNYSITVPTGTFVVRFTPKPSTGLAPAFYDGTVSGAPSPAQARRLTVASTSTTVALINDQPVIGLTITGTVGNGTVGLPGIDVHAGDFSLINTCCLPEIAQAVTGSGGSYTLVVPPGTVKYLVSFNNTQAQSYLQQWYNGAVSQSSATAVTGGAIKVDAALQLGHPVTGTVTSGGSVVPGVNVFLGDLVCCTNFGISGGQTDSSGKFRLLAPLGEFAIHFGPPAGFLGQTIAVTVTASGATQDASLQPGAVISGQVTNGTSGVPGVRIRAYDSNFGGCCNDVQSDSSGGYQITVPVGDWKLWIDPNGGAGLLAPQFYNGIAGGAPDPSGATAIHIAAVTDRVTAVAQVLSNGQTITGTITNTAPTGIPGMRVFARKASLACCFPQVEEATTDFAGHYQLVVPAGTYNLDVATVLQPSGYVGTSISGVAAGSVAPTVALQSGYELSGRVTGTAGGLSGVSVNVDRADTGAQVVGTGSGLNGAWAVMTPAGGTYKVFFDPAPISSTLAGKWYKDQTTLATATPVPGAGGLSGPVTGIDQQLI